MIEIITLIGVIILLFVTIVLKEYFHNKIVDRLLEKLMALTNDRAFINYSNAEISKTSIKNKPQEQQARVKFPA